MSADSFRILVEITSKPVALLESNFLMVFTKSVLFIKGILKLMSSGINGPRQANLVLIAYASSEGSGEPAHPRSLARTFAARS